MPPPPPPPEEEERPETTRRADGETTTETGTPILFSLPLQDAMVQQHYQEGQPLVATFIVEDDNVAGEGNGGGNGGSDFTFQGCDSGDNGGRNGTTAIFLGCDGCALDQEENKLNVLPSEGVEEGNGDAAAVTTPYCHLVSLSPFFRNYTDGLYERHQSSFEAAIATALAVHHLNVGDGSIVPQLHGLNETCPVRFTIDFVDTAFQPGTGLRRLISRLQQGVAGRRPPPCAFVGAFSSAVSVPTSIVTGLQHFPQVSGVSTSTDLDDTTQFPNFARTVPSDAGTAYALVYYLRHVLKINHIAILAVNDAFGNAYVARIRDAAVQLARDEEKKNGSNNKNDEDGDLNYDFSEVEYADLVQLVESQHDNNNIGDNFLDDASAFRGLTADLSNRDLAAVGGWLHISQVSIDYEATNAAEAIASLKDTDYRFFFAILSSARSHDKVMLEAFQQRIAGTGKHNWIFSDGLSGNLEGRSFVKESPLYLAYRGAGMVKASAGVQGVTPVYDTFVEKLSAIKESPEDIEYLEAVLPKPQASAEDESFILNYNHTAANSTTLDDNFLNPMVYDPSAFVYEATVVLGMAACRAMSDDYILNGKQFRTAIGETDFDGITGHVKLNPLTGTRFADTTLFEIVNYQAEALTMKPDSLPNTHPSVSMVQFRAVKSSLFNNNTWRELTPFIYNDLTTNVPLGIPPADVQVDIINTATRVIALLFCALSWILAAACVIWTYRNRNTRIVRASQPFFLYILCAGCVILASAIIALSFDTDILSVDGCSRACTSAVWLFAMGMAIIFSALFSKTHRVRRIMKSATKFKRIQLSTYEVMIPMACLLTVNIIILTVLTVLNPIEYGINIVGERDAFGRPMEVYGKCIFSGHLGFLLPVFLLNVGMLLLAVFEAWNARNLSTEFQESEQIFKALLSILLVVFVGCPVFIIVEDNPDTSLFILSAIIFVACLAILLFIFVPKFRFDKEKRPLPATAGSHFNSGGVKVTGLEATRQSNQKGYSFMVSIITPPTGVVASQSSEDGDRILGLKSRKELAEEVQWLKNRVEEMERQKQEHLVPATKAVQGANLDRTAPASTDVSMTGCDERDNREDHANVEEEASGTNV